VAAVHINEHFTLSGPGRLCYDYMRIFFDRGDRPVQETGDRFHLGGNFAPMGGGPKCTQPFSWIDYGVERSLVPSLETVGLVLRHRTAWSGGTCVSANIELVSRFLKLCPTGPCRSLRSHSFFLRHKNKTTLHLFLADAGQIFDLRNSNFSFFFFGESKIGSP